MAFTGLTKYGFTDGEQVGRWGDQFPAFIRIKAGDTLPYIVFREDNANHPTAGRFGNMFYADRSFIRNTIFGASKSDADLFADKPNNLPDTSEPGSSFVLKDTTTLLFKRPDTGTPITTPVVTNPTTTNPTTTNPATTTPATTTPATTVPISNAAPTTTTTTTTTNNPTAMTPTTKWAIIGVAVIVVAGILYMVLKGSGNQANYGPRRRYGRY